jgi:hypothetical protein
METDDKLISEFTLCKKANPDNFTWWNYVNMKTDLPTALGIANFFLPDLIIKKGCLILKDHFDEDVFNGWYKEFKGDKIQVEKAVNYYEIKDFFEINTDFEDPNIEKMLKSFSKKLQFMWMQNFKKKYPDKKIVVKLSHEYETICITVFEEK